MEKKELNLSKIVIFLLFFLLFFLLLLIGKGSYGVGDVYSNSKSLSLTSNTVCDFIENSDLCINNLNARIYVSDVNSSKWAVLIHGYTSSSQSSLKKISSSYISRGYNIIATDNRGHGNSGGKVAWSYLESLDVYDWIKDLNINWNKSDRYGVNVAPEIIVVHGISLGGGTTLQLATNPDIASANGTEPFTKNLTQLNVKGFFDDCGFVSIFNTLVRQYSIELKSTSSDKIDNVLNNLFGETLSQYGIGIPSGYFSKYENVFSEGRKFPENSKIVVVHDKSDKVVPYSNSEYVSNNISPGILLHMWSPNGLGHAFISHELEIAKYNRLVSEFLTCVEDTSCTSVNFYS